MIRIDAESLFDGEVFLEDHSLIIDGATITHAGPTSELSAEHSVLTAERHRAVLPGLWDTHAHFFGVRELTMQAMLQTPAATAGARAAADAGAMLRSGITSVREAGGYGVFLAAALADGSIDGPNVYAAGAIIGSTGGHGDFASAPLHWMTSEYRPPQFHLADGPDECVRAVRHQIRRCAQVIKVVASGGVLTPHDDPDQRQYSDRELRAIVETAGEAGRHVMAHATGKSAMLASIAAGVHTIEHGTFLDGEVVQAMVESGTILVPTLTILKLNLTRQLPPPVRAKAERAAAIASDSVTAAYEAGVPIAAGSDLGVYLTPEGRVNGVQEIEHLHAAGLSIVDALRAATSVAARTVGDRSRSDGGLRPGCVADLIAVGDDPLSRIQAVTADGAVTKVWKNGVAQ